MTASDSRAQELIDRILASSRMRSSSHFSSRVYDDEPILTTGRQMAGYLPDRYREMKRISRWQADCAGDGRGRWLSEAELFWQQGTFMADWEDDCPYHGTFDSRHPTYDAMSDRQLRGYFTWRTAARQGRIERLVPSFALVYLYELICGIGVESPADGLQRLQRFWRAYRARGGELPRDDVATWIMDYAVYHGIGPDALDGELLDGLHVQRDDLARLELARGVIDAAGQLGWRPRNLDPWRILPLGESSKATDEPEGQGQKRRARERSSMRPGVPPLAGDVEERIFGALDSLTGYGKRLASPFAHDHRDDLRHVAVAAFLRLADYYDANRKQSLLESWLGVRAETPYTMFAGAIFFEPAMHGDCSYELDPLRTFRCRKGLWTRDIICGWMGNQVQLQHFLMAVDARMQGDGEAPTDPVAERFGAPKTPKYLQKIIDEEAAAHEEWQEAHKPFVLELDLGKLDGIRDAAAGTREALLTDEERSGVAEAETEGASESEPEIATEPEPEPEAAQAPVPDASGSSLSPAQTAFVRALLAEDPALRTAALSEAACSEDMLVDAVNEALFDYLGDTALEFGSQGPQVIDDYREDVEEILNHAS